MNFSLTPELEAMVREKVASGLYISNSEVVREALRLMDQHDKLEGWRAATARGPERVADGEGVSVAPQPEAEVDLAVDAGTRLGESPN